MAWALGKQAKKGVTNRHKKSNLPVSSYIEKNNTS